MHLFEGQNANEVWQMALAELGNNLRSHHQSGRGGETEELLHAAFVIADSRQRWVIARQPPMNPAFAIAEVVWIVAGRKDSAFLNFWNPQLPKYAGTGEEYHGAYGYRLRHQFGIDQLERAYLSLKNNPNGRQIVLQIWDPNADSPDQFGQPINTDIPCNVMSLLKIRNGKLEWLQISRSNDIFLGIPHNFIQFTSLQEIMAGWLGVGIGTYTHISDSLHLYNEDSPNVSADGSIVTLPNTDSLHFPKDESDMLFAELNQCMSSILSATLTQTSLQTLVHHSGLPSAFQNMLIVVAADAARRKRWVILSQELMVLCSNPMLTQIWSQWVRRFQQ